MNVQDANITLELNQHSRKGYLWFGLGKYDSLFFEKIIHSSLPTSLTLLLCFTTITTIYNTKKKLNSKQNLDK